MKLEHLHTRAGDSLNCSGCGEVVFKPLEMRRGVKMTPGPWTITERIGEGDKVHENDWPGVGISFRQPKTSGGDYAHNEAIQVWGEACEANARAIATLPELVEAARNVLDDFDRHLHGIKSDNYQEHWKSLRRILARIDGEGA